MPRLRWRHATRTRRPEQQQGWRELLTLHREQLREWAEKLSTDFRYKHALVLAEIARLEGRDLEAMRQYEQGILLAREHGCPE